MSLNWQEVARMGFEQSEGPRNMPRVMTSYNNPPPEGFTFLDLDGTADGLTNTIEIVDDQPLARSGSQFTRHYAVPNISQGSSYCLMYRGIGAGAQQPKGARVNWWMRFLDFPPMSRGFKIFYMMNWAYQQPLILETFLVHANEVVPPYSDLGIWISIRGMLGAPNPERGADFSYAQLNTWYNFDAYYVEDAVDGEYRFSIDGVEKIAQKGFNNVLSEAQKPRMFDIGIDNIDFPEPITHTVDVDDVILYNLVEGQVVPYYKVDSRPQGLSFARRKVA